jgi:hypothetical protein
MEGHLLLFWMGVIKRMVQLRATVVRLRGGLEQPTSSKLGGTSWELASFTELCNKEKCGTASFFAAL